MTARLEFRKIDRLSVGKAIYIMKKREKNVRRPPPGGRKEGRGKRMLCFEEAVDKEGALLYNHIWL